MRGRSSATRFLKALLGHATHRRRRRSGLNNDELEGGFIENRGELWVTGWEADAEEFPQPI